MQIITDIINSWKHFVKLHIRYILQSLFRKKSCSVSYYNVQNFSYFTCIGQGPDNIPYIPSSYKSAALTVQPMRSIVRYSFDGSYSYTIYHGHYRLRNKLPLFAFISRRKPCSLRRPVKFVDSVENFEDASARGGFPKIAD